MVLYSITVNVLSSIFLRDAIGTDIENFTGNLRFEPKPKQAQAELGLRDEEDHDDDDEEEDDFEIGDSNGDTDGGGDGEILLSDFGGERNALIFNEEVEDATQSYSSMRFARSSSDLMETKASRSSVGNWQRRLTSEQIDR